METHQISLLSTLNLYLRQVKKYTGKLFPLLLVIAVLPALVVLAASLKSLNLSSSAKGENQLRLFFEPTTVSTRVNQPVKLTLTAAYEEGGKIVPGFSAIFTSDNSLQIFPQRVEYKMPFRGRVFVETVEVIPSRSGVFSLEIPAEQAVTTNMDIKFKTVPATIIVN